MAAARIRETPAEKRKRSDFTACNISNWLRKNHLSVGCSQHTVDNGLSVGQELVKAGLHNYVIRCGQGCSPSKVPYLPARTPLIQAFDESATEIKARITD
jgi:hypothetical protein